MQCATHPSVETELACSRCEKPICPQCLVHTPVGARCRECANVRRIPTYNVSTPTIGRAIGGATVGAIAMGIAWWLFNLFTGLFFGLFVGLAVGYAIGELVSLATNRRSGPPLQAIAAGGVVLAYVIRLALLFALGEWMLRDLRTDLFGVIAAGIGVFIAVGRLR